MLTSFREEPQVPTLALAPLRVLRDEGPPSSFLSRRRVSSRPADHESRLRNDEHHGEREAASSGEGVKPGVRDGEEESPQGEDDDGTRGDSPHEPEAARKEARDRGVRAPRPAEAGNDDAEGRQQRCPEKEVRTTKGLVANPTRSREGDDAGNCVPDAPHSLCEASLSRFHHSSSGSGQDATAGSQGCGGGGGHSTPGWYASYGSCRHSFGEAAWVSEQTASLNAQPPAPQDMEQSAAGNG